MANTLEVPMKLTYRIINTTANTLFILNLFTIPKTKVKTKVTRENPRTIITRRLSWMLAILKRSNFWAFPVIRVVLSIEIPNPMRYPKS